MHPYKIQLKQNCRYWAENNPQEVHQVAMHPAKVTQCVILSDSDEDYDPKKGNKRKKKHKKLRKGDMNSAEDSDVSVIEIQSDDDDSNNDPKDSPKRGRGRPNKKSVASDLTESVKRRRGRPPKLHHSDTEESPQKKIRTDPDEVGSDTVKNEFKCPHCTKTFPSQNSLSTHIQHHNLENSLRNSHANKAKSTVIEYKHRCETCQMTFKNTILLRRHVCPKQTEKSTNKRLDCSVCKKSFLDLKSLNVHKRSHVKENLVNSTTTSVVKTSPKKLIPRPSTGRFKSPARQSVSKSTFKCKDCSRVCYSQESLNLHEKTHKRFPCPSCNSTFPSRLLLDTHIRVSCVKNSPQLNKRLSFKIKKSFVQSPRRKSMRFPKKSLATNLNTTAKTTVNNSLNLNLQCEYCNEKFTLYQDYFKHQVKMHGLETPDKSVLAEKQKLLHKPKTVHGGIPARENMRKVFANMKTQMALLTPKK